LNQEPRIVGVDPGKQKDSFAMVTITIRDKIIFVLGAKGWVGRAYLQVEEELADIHEIYPADLYVVEKNNIGDHVIEVLKFQKHLYVMGVTTSSNIKNRAKHPDTMDKNEMVRWMLTIMQEGRLIFPDKDSAETAELKRQLSIFAEKKTASGSVSYGAEGQEHDDYVMALMLACFAAKTKYLKAGSGRHLVASTKGTRPGSVRGSSLGYGEVSLGRTIRYPDGSFG
jgi:hypothetical protein